MPRGLPPPTARERQAAGLYKRLKTHGAVARELGISSTAARALTRRFWAKEGIIPPEAHPSRIGHHNLLRINDLTARVGVLEARLVALETRPPDIIEWHPDHRHLKDGGTHVSEQRKLLGLPRHPRKKR